MKPKRKTWIKIDRYGRIQWFRSDLRRKHIFNYRDSKFDYENEEILARKRASSHRELDWRDTFLDDPLERDGFLAPDGVWTGCPYGLHSECANLVFGGKITSDLERMGYVHISGEPMLHRDQSLTKKQYEWLLDHGYRKFACDRYQEPRRLAFRSGLARDPAVDALLGSSVEVGLRKLSQRTGD